MRFIAVLIVYLTIDSTTITTMTDGEASITIPIIDISGYLAGDVVGKAAEFNKSVAPLLTKKLEDALKGE